MGAGRRVRTETPPSFPHFRVLFSLLHLRKEFVISFPQAWCCGYQKCLEFALMVYVVFLCHQFNFLVKSSSLSNEQI